MPPAYTCIARPACRMIPSQGNNGRCGRIQCRQTSSIVKWDRVWIGDEHRDHGRGPHSLWQAASSAALAVSGERIAWIGAAEEARTRARARGIPIEEAEGLWMTPGLIDCHTHLVYGGNRVAEFEQRLCGVPYEEIARSGGGIQSTVNATRRADFESLAAAATSRARRLMAEGVTTLEVKSGYGLDLATERRMLEVARSLERDLPLSIATTFLGLHALPAEYRDRRHEYVAAVCGPWLESLTAAGLVDAVDAFCENIAFTAQETDRVSRGRRAARPAGARARGSAERHGRRGDRGAPSRAVRRPSRIPERGGRARARPGRHGGGALARGLLHLAADHAAAGARCCAPPACPWPYPPTAIPVPRPACRCCSPSTWPAACSA